MSIVAREIASDDCGCGCGSGTGWLNGSNNVVWIIIVVIIILFAFSNRCWGGFGGPGGFGALPYGGYGAAVGVGRDCDCECKKCCRRCC